MSKVYVVFCMDTEGPCDDPNNDELLKNWSSVDTAMDKLFDENFRSLYTDSYGKKFKIGWFFLNWSGFKTNPRGRDFGYHKVRDHYLKRWGDKIENYGDEHCWHYHHPPISGIGNEWSKDWSSSCEYKNIISRQIIERKWFPICFRAGGTIMDSNLSCWVDQWFPFDFSNRAPLKNNEMDWSDGIAKWQPYHPDPKWFKLNGNGRRLMARCLDLQTNLYVTSKDDIFNAFNEASTSGNSILSVFDHDYRDIKERIIKFISIIDEVSDNFPDVNWEYSGPSNAISKIKNIVPQMALKIRLEIENKKLKIISNSEIHQSYPWIAVKDIEGNFHHVEKNIKKVSSKEWGLILDPYEDIDVIGVAASNNSGESNVQIIEY